MSSVAAGSNFAKVAGVSGRSGRSRCGGARAYRDEAASAPPTLGSTYHVGMPRPSNKDKLLTDGLRLVHERGFGASSVRDITQAAGVPQGSFTNHFASKEAFGLEILERYREMTSAGVRATLRNDRLPPLRRLRGWIDRQLEYLRKDDMRRGCLYGNLSAEASESSEAIRFRVASVFAENQASLAYCLEAAIDAGELAPDTNVQVLAGFIVSSLQGAILVAKAQRSPIPVERFERVLFQHLLPRADARSSRRRRRAPR
jgi:TetR/AcrR family transcriptional regulator, transcriptional repressor for nem operon